MKARIAVSILSLSLAVLSLLLGDCYGKEPVSDNGSSASAEAYADYEPPFIENSLR